MIVSTRPMIWMSLLAALALAFTRTPGIEEAWQRNRVSLAIWQQVDIPRSRTGLDGRLYSKAGNAPAAMAQQIVPPCQYLWVSYLQAPADLNQARQAAARAQGCPRPELLKRWAGTLAWLSGDPAGARQAWAALPAANLVSWGRDLALHSETETARAKAKALLQIAAALQPDQTLTPNQRALLFQTLGDLAREAGALEQATTYLERAWIAAGKNYGQAAYSLGTSYATQGDCQRAIEVMEYSLQHKPEQTRPQLDTSYLLRLGECHLRVGNYTQANRYLNAAQTLIDAYDLKNRRTWLDHIQQMLP